MIYRLPSSDNSGGFDPYSSDNTKNAACRTNDDPNRLHFGVFLKILLSSVFHLLQEFVAVAVMLHNIIKVFVSAAGKADED